MKRKHYPLMMFGLLLGLALVVTACATEDPGLQVGDPAPAFSAQTADGSRISLSDYDGQPVLLYFHMALG